MGSAALERGKMMDGAEKRKYKRAYVKLTVECRGKNFWQMVEAQDISAGGMFVATEKVEPPQTKLEVMFELGKEDKKKTIRAEAVVAWNRPQAAKDEKGEIRLAGMGIMFTKVTPLASKNIIEDIVKTPRDKSRGFFSV